MPVEIWRQGEVKHQGTKAVNFQNMVPRPAATISLVNLLETNSQALL